MATQYADDEAENRGLAVYQAPAQTPGFLLPLGSAQEARAAIQAYEALKSAIVQPDDVQVIQGRKFLKKSFWRRVAACFGLSLELVSEERLILDGRLAYRATYRAIAPNGRTMDSDGMCSTAEQGHGGWPEHNVRATAHTRAKNRAISDLVGGGEVSAEEMQDEDLTRRAASASAPAVTPIITGAHTREADPERDRIGEALKQKPIFDLLVKLHRFNDVDRRRELQSVFEAIEAAGEKVNGKTVKTELAARIADAIALASDSPPSDADADADHDLAELDSGPRPS